MRTAFLTILRLLTPLLGAVSAQDMSQSDASLLAYQAFGRWVSIYLTAGQSLRKDEDFIFVTPLTEYGIPGGAPVPQSITNYQLWQRVDALQSPDNPLYIAGGARYVPSLNRLVLAISNLSLYDRNKHGYSSLTI